MLRQVFSEPWVLGSCTFCMGRHCHLAKPEERSLHGGESLHLFFGHGAPCSPPSRAQPRTRLPATGARSPGPRRCRSCPAGAAFPWAGLCPSRAGVGQAGGREGDCVPCLRAEGTNPLLGAPPSSPPESPPEAVLLGAGVHTIPQGRPGEDVTHACALEGSVRPGAFPTSTSLRPEVTLRGRHHAGPLPSPLHRGTGF